MEKGVKTPDGWVFNTFKGRVFRISYAGAFKIEELFTITDEEGLWRVGGMQPLAYHTDANLLLALMHQGGEHTHKDPGTEVWMYDLGTKRLLHQLKLENPAVSLLVSQDENPRIYTSFVPTGKVEVYDLRQAKLLNSFTVSGPTILQNL